MVQVTGSLTSYTSLPHRLRQARVNLGWSNLRLATEVDCSPSMISFLQTGDRTPSLALLEDLATVLGVEPAWLTYGVGPDR